MEKLRENPQLTNDLVDGTGTFITTNVVGG
jgi:hypothetical protein